MNKNIGDFRENKGIGSGFKKLMNKWDVEVSNEKRSNSSSPKNSNKEYLNPLKKVLKFHNLTITHPEIAKDWDYEKNEKRPEEYLDRSGKTVWWKCEKGHSWKDKIANRTVRKSGCPVCLYENKHK